MPSVDMLQMIEDSNFADRAHINAAFAPNRQRKNANDGNVFLERNDRSYSPKNNGQERSESYPWKQYIPKTRLRTIIFQKGLSTVTRHE